MLHAAARALELYCSTHTRKTFTCICSSYMGIVPIGVPTDIGYPYTVHSLQMPALCGMNSILLELGTLKIFLLL